MATIIFTDDFTIRSVWWNKSGVLGVCREILEWNPTVPDVRHFDPYCCSACGRDMSTINETNPVFCTRECYNERN